SSSAVSQAVKQLEHQLRVVLLTRTTRSVSLTDAGARLVENAGPALKHALEALTQVSAKPGEVVGRVKLSVSRMAVALLITPVLPTYRRGGHRGGPPRRYRGGRLRRGGAARGIDRPGHGADPDHRRVPLRDRR